MDWLVIAVHRGLLERLGKCRVRVARPCDVLGTRAVLHAQNTLGNHLACFLVDLEYERCVCTPREKKTLKVASLQDSSSKYPE